MLPPKSNATVVMYHAICTCERSPYVPLFCDEFGSVGFFPAELFVELDEDPWLEGEPFALAPVDGFAGDEAAGEVVGVAVGAGSSSSQSSSSSSS